MFVLFLYHYFCIVVIVFVLFALFVCNCCCLCDVCDVSVLVLGLLVGFLGLGEAWVWLEPNGPENIRHNV